MGDYKGTAFDEPKMNQAPLDCSQVNSLRVYLADSLVNTVYVVKVGLCYPLSQVPYHNKAIT